MVFVSRQLGHASPTTTLGVYAHLFEQVQHAATARAALDGAGEMHRQSSFLRVPYTLPHGRGMARPAAAPHAMVLEGRRG